MSGEKEAKKQALVAKESHKLATDGRELRRKQQVVADLKKERTLSIALGEGIKWGGIVSTLVGAGTYGMSQYNARFNKMMSISAKVSLPIMTGLFAFGLQCELKMHDVHRFPEVRTLFLLRSSSLCSSYLESFTHQLIPSRSVSEIWYSC